MVEKLRKFENLHILFWLIKDAAWVSGYNALGVVMILPTWLMAVWITWKLRKSMTELAHNIAVVCWISANSIWMIGEFYYNDTTRFPAKMLFFAGIIILAGHYSWAFILKLKRRNSNEMN